MKRLRSKRKLLENQIFENQFLKAKMENLRNETSTCFKNGSPKVAMHLLRERRWAIWSDLAFPTFLTHACCCLCWIV